MIRRFDKKLLQPPMPGSGVDERLLASVKAWCEVASTGPVAAASIAPNAGLDGVARELDGSHALARMGRWRGLAWRLRLAAGDRSTRVAPWDCGWWLDGPLNVASAFRPRRATLMMVRDAEPGRVVDLLVALTEQASHYARPLRVLVVAGPATGSTVVRTITLPR